MHELAIAENIISAVIEKQRAARLGRITAVGLRIGELTDIVADALTFGYTCATVDTPLANSRLEIERVPISGNCRSCGGTVEVADFRFTCPHCQSSDLDIQSGLELEIAWLEVDEDSSEHHPDLLSSQRSHHDK